MWVQLSILQSNVSDLRYDGQRTVGSLIGDSFKETLGTREGAVESSHLFIVYISGLRDKA